MDWQQFTHGTNGLVLGLICVALPMWVAMVLYRAPFMRWLLSPICVLVLMIVAAVVLSLLVPVLKGITGFGENDPVLIFIAMGACSTIGYLGGRFVSGPA